MSEGLSERERRSIVELAKVIDYDQSRIISILERVALKRKSGISSLPSFFAATIPLPTKEAVSIFENEDWDELSKGESFGEWWVHELTPCYLLGELQSIVEQFILFLESNKDSLVKTGVPGLLFSESDWLNCYLSHLYYAWADSGSEEHLLVTGLTAEESARIVDGRSRFLDLKIQVLWALARALSKGKPGGLLEACFVLIDGQFSVDDIFLYLQVDNLYPHYGDPCEYPMPAGGLLNLLYVIGHVQKELSVGTLDQVSQCLPGIGSYIGPEAAYYQLIDDYGFADVNTAVRACDALREKENAFWQAYVKAITEFIDELSARSRSQTPTQDNCVDERESPARECADWISRLIARSLPWSASPSPKFLPSDNYRVVTIGDVQIPLSDVQAATVRILHEAYVDGSPIMSWGSIRRALENGERYFSPSRFNHIWRGLTRDEVDMLVKRVKKDQWRLNLE